MRVQEAVEDEAPKASKKGKEEGLSDGDRKSTRPASASTSIEPWRSRWYANKKDFSQHC